MSWLLVLILKECLVECATLCVKSEVMLTRISSMVINHDTKVHTGHLITIMLSSLFFTKEIEQKLPQGVFSPTFWIQIMRGSLFWPFQKMQKKSFFLKGFYATFLWVHYNIFKKCPWKHEKIFPELQNGETYHIGTRAEAYSVYLLCAFLNCYIT